MPSVQGLSSPIVHADCICNEYVSVRNRVIGRVPLPTDLTQLRITVAKFKRYMPIVERCSHYDFYKDYPSVKRRAYEEASESLSYFPIDKVDARIKCFVKCERVDPISKINPDPRMISARSRRYVLEVGTYLKPLEHHFYKTKLWFPDKIIAKNMNARQRARSIIRKMSRFDNPCVVSLDCSRWDKHVALEVLQEEHRFYNSILRDSHLAWLLSLQLVNHCTTRSGIGYIARGRRMSGDYNTAFGNCVLMTAMTIAILETFKIKYNLLDDGDDCLVFIDATNQWVLKELSNHYLNFGQEVKVENIAYIPEKVVFCQSSPVYIGSIWKMVRKPMKVISNTCTGFHKMMDLAQRKNMLYAVGMCELALNRDVPILHHFAMAVVNLGAAIPDVLNRIHEDSGFRGLYIRIKDFKQLYQSQPKITSEARISFNLAFGIDINRQLQLEAYFDSWHPDVFDDHFDSYDWCMNAIPDECVLAGI